MKSFQHVNAKTVKEASKMLDRSKGKASLVAGGTDLLGILKDKVLPDYPETIINLKSVPNLDYIKEDAQGLRIGALAKLADIVSSPIVQKQYKVLAEAAEAVATPQIRNLATIGGNICQDVRCWYYRYPHQIGGRILCARKKERLPRKDGQGCHALTGDNRYHSIFGAVKVGKTPCTAECPVGIDIPLYLSKIREGDLIGAAKILLEANPIPAITGRVCPHFCQERCNRGDHDGPVSIRNVERFMGDYILENAGELIIPPENTTNKGVAILGAGPAGLSAAFYLRRFGHRVVVFDRMSAPGGMLAYALPAYRLPGECIDAVVKLFERLGIEFKLNVEVGKDVTLEDLRKDFDSLFLATGAPSSPPVGIEGENLTIPGLQFLAEVKRGGKDVAGSRILVIGGGSVAIDVGITARRLGAKEVILACLESREEMPALGWEVEKAVEEGVELMPSWGPFRIVEGKGKVRRIGLMRCKSVFDKKGKFAPVLDDHVKETLEADLIILATGQKPDLSYINARIPMKTEKGLIFVKQQTQETSSPGVFAGGDVTSGPASVVEAVAGGRRAAFAIDRFLRGSKVDAVGTTEGHVEGLLDFKSDYLKPTDPVRMPERPLNERNINAEDLLGLKLHEVNIEANRCFNCGCVAVNASDIAPVLVALDARIKTTKRTIGAEAFFSVGRVNPRIPTDGEIVTEILIPPPRNGAKLAYEKFGVRSSIDFPMVSVASAYEMDSGTFKEARIVLGAVAPIPVRAKAAEDLLKGKALSEELAEQAASMALQNANPLCENAYKVEIAKALIKRSILAAEKPC